MSKGEWKALKQLRSDKGFMIITANKGVSMVIIIRKNILRSGEPTRKYGDIQTYSI